ncbi:uncharacterized protein RCO7_07684 [Rhynchosporium graminicola]|uniref:Uncharacterized protein n=1 Tax=Rhynchosporium graminicola TaxID=2792576 RepID=A0A1E1LPV1_9HELO|nr:uncharacterized protein RCO7_07684 [Rhynchosporium commune]
MSKSIPSRSRAAGASSHTRPAIKKAGLAWNITPPPDGSPPEDAHALDFTSRCLLEVHEQVNIVRQDLRNLQDRQRYGDDIATSPVSQVSLDGRLYDIEERTGALEAQSKVDDELRELLIDTKDVLKDKIGTLGLALSDLDGKVENLGVELSDLHGKVDTLGVELSDLDVDRLVQLLTFYSIDFHNWYHTYPDTDSDDDSTDLDHPQPEPSSIREAAKLRPKRAVMALFGHLGLPYHVLEDQTKREQVMFTERKRRKDDEALEMKGRKSKQQYVASGRGLGFGPNAES